MFKLNRVRDGVGDSGAMSRALWDEAGEVKTEENARPRVGVQMIVGSHFARTMEAQDFWHTTTITEILEEKEDYVKFRTGNSTYEWKVI